MVTHPECHLACHMDVAAALSSVGLQAQRSARPQLAAQQVAAECGRWSLSGGSNAACALCSQLSGTLFRWLVPWEAAV
jgi:hypothetical protein